MSFIIFGCHCEERSDVAIPTTFVIARLVRRSFSAGGRLLPWQLMFFITPIPSIGAAVFYHLAFFVI